MTAIVANVTVTEPTESSYLTVYPDGPRPLASNLNYLPGQTVPNLAVIPLSSAGKIDFFNRFGSTHVILDLVGWFGAPAPAP
jgi:hypothetical protein